MVYYLVAVLYILTCLMLLLVVLLQQGKGGDMASTVLGILFMIGAIALGILGRRGPGSVMQGVGGAAPQQQQQQQTPPQPK